MGNLPGKYSPLFSRHTSGGPYTIAGIDECPGDVWFVDSSATSAANNATHGYTPDEPFATLAYAFSSARVASGDVVYVMPGHAEAVSAAGDITMNVAGVRVVGLGSGSSRPTFTFDTVNTATWLITSANITVENVLITVNGVLDMASAITVTAADCLLRDVEVRDSAADSQFVNPIIVGAGGARCRLVRYICRSHAAGDAAQSGVLVSAVVDGVEVDDAQLDGLFLNGCIYTSAANTNMKVRRCELRQRHAATAAAVNLNAGTTGMIRDTVAFITLATGAGFNGAFVSTLAIFDSCRAVNTANTATSEPLLAAGRYLSRATGAIVGNPTIDMFTIAGGDVMIKKLWLKVTTAVAADGGTLAVQINPTAGDTYVIVTATDLGTVDTAVGSIVGIDAAAAAAPSFLRGGRVDINAPATTGAIEIVGAAGVDGNVTMHIEWEPITAGATVVVT
jgi:hypothetical protein